MIGNSRLPPSFLYRVTTFIYIYIQVELDDVTSQLKSTDEMLKTASADAARLAEELRQEQEHSMHVDRMRRALEVQIKEMQVQINICNTDQHLNAFIF